MKEVHETVVLNVPEMLHKNFSSNLNSSRPISATELQHSDFNMTSGEAPMDVEKEDEITSSTPGNVEHCKICEFFPINVDERCRLELAISVCKSANSQLANTARK